MAAPYHSRTILGIRFFNDDLERALHIARDKGGLVLAPSGPGLAGLGKNPHYDAALRSADVNLIDSGYLAVLWRKRTGEQLRRHSGLKFIQALIDCPSFKAESRQLWVMPGEAHAESTRAYLAGEGIALPERAFYVAPFYKEMPVRDRALLERIRESSARYVILCIAGGKQEILGHWLRRELDDGPAIICIGAAIAFLSGQQAKIPAWADRIYIGWLLRILADPKTFLPRYWKARKLKQLLHRYGEKAPAPRVEPRQPA